MQICDMSEYNVRLPFALHSVKCIGWLDEKCDYEVFSHKIPEYFDCKLHDIICRRTDKFDAHANVMRGIKECNICHVRIDIACGEGDRAIPLGMSEIWIPDADSQFWFAAPSLIYHYVKNHKYKAPLTYIESVLKFDINKSYSAQKVYQSLVKERMKRGDIHLFP